MAVAGELSTDDSISLIMGSYSSSISIPASAVASRNNKIYWESGSTSPELMERGLPNLYHTNLIASMPVCADSPRKVIEDIVARTLGKSVSDLRIGLAYEDGAYGVSTSEVFTALA